MHKKGMQNMLANMQNLGPTGGLSACHLTGMILQVFQDFNGKMMVKIEIPAIKYVVVLVITGLLGEGQNPKV